MRGEKLRVKDLTNKLEKKKTVLVFFYKKNLIVLVAEFSSVFMEFEQLTQLSIKRTSIIAKGFVYLNLALSHICQLIFNQDIAFYYYLRYCKIIIQLYLIL